MDLAQLLTEKAKYRAKAIAINVMIAAVLFDIPGVSPPQCGHFWADFATSFWQWRQVVKLGFISFPLSDNNFNRRQYNVV